VVPGTLPSYVFQFLVPTKILSFSAFVANNFILLVLRTCVCYCVPHSLDEMLQTLTNFSSEQEFAKLCCSDRHISTDPNY